MLDRAYVSWVVHVGATGRFCQGIGQIKSYVLSILAMFPNLAATLNDLYRMGSQEDGFMVAARWNAIGARLGNGSYGDPTGREVHLRGNHPVAIQG